MDIVLLALKQLSQVTVLANQVTLERNAMCHKPAQPPAVSTTLPVTTKVIAVVHLEEIQPTATITTPTKTVSR